MYIPVFVAIIIVLVVIVLILKRERVALQRARLEHDIENKELKQPLEREAKKVEKRLPAVEAEVPPAVKVEAEPLLQMPEDSALRRHFLTHLRADVEAESPPLPTDSTLARHHEQLVVAEMEKRAGEPLPEVRAAESVLAAPATPMRVVELPVKKEVKIREEVKAKPKPVAAAEGPLEVPEDLTLRRHFLTQLRAEIEARMPPAPTDASLRRHYNATVDAELEKWLAGGTA